jgi:hypothetical protein
MQRTFKGDCNLRYFKFSSSRVVFVMDASANYLNELSNVILKSAISVHKEMGPGLLESVYQECMILDLRN